MQTLSPPPSIAHPISSQEEMPEWIEYLSQWLPAEYATKAQELKAFVRVRAIPTVDHLLRALFCWAFASLSLRQLGLWATLQQVGHLSDRAWSQRIQKATPWILWLLGQMLLPAGPSALSGRRVRIIDGSLVRMRQANGISLRVHTSYCLNEHRIDTVYVTTQTTAESVLLFHWQAKDIAIMDRNFCRRTQIGPLLDQQVDIVGRWHSTNFPLLTLTSTPFDVLTWLKEQGETVCECRCSDGEHRLRFIASPLPPKQAKRARKKARRMAQKKQHAINESTVFFAGWLLLLTSLSPEEASTEQVVELYRARWQVECLFKRIKQLLRLHRLPSFELAANQAYVGLILCGWLILEAQQHQWETLIPGPPTSLWQCQALLVQTFRQVLLGYWSFATLFAHWGAVQRYLRPSRPSRHLWSFDQLVHHIEHLFSFP